MQSEDKKILVISHNVFSPSENMGKTLLGYFENWDSDKLAQLYFHSQVPVNDKCIRYFNITDADALKSIFIRKNCGCTYNKNDIKSYLKTSRVDSGLKAMIYKTSRKRTPLIYMLRNFIWDLSNWKNKKLDHWLDEFKPEAVFFAAGDYTFSYKIALKIAKERNIPLYVSCMDDYYFHNKNHKFLLGRIQYRNFIKWVEHTIKYTDCIFTICDKMASDYSVHFKKPCYTIHTPASIKQPSFGNKEKKIVYLGNLGYKRNKQLIDIGQALKKIKSPDLPDHIDVYSFENRKEILGDLKLENGIVFHGGITAEDVEKKIKNSLLVIYTESFDNDIRPRIKYSVSTKIADSLASGTCIFAYGPHDIASIEYLTKNHAAFVVNKKENLATELLSIMTNADLRSKIIKNAIHLAKQNHCNNKTSNIINEIINRK